MLLIINTNKKGDTMEKWTRLNLTIEKGYHIRINNDYLEPFKEELLQFVDEQQSINNLLFAKKMMMSQEIKANNTIEGINNDLTIIDEVIDKRKVPLSTSERKRIINLYHGYQYILTHKDINKESLRELYSILSDGILEPYDYVNLGKYYRTKPVYILKGRSLSVEPFKGVDSDKIDYYMNQFFEYVNSDNNDTKDIDTFIKSQVMHFYFVYIHPYFDVNGRTSRTVSMWYLLNNKSYPYIIFNRAIAYSQKNYEPTIIKAREYGDVTLFLKYMIENVHKELEREYVITNISEHTEKGLTKQERQMLEYFLNINGNLNAKELVTIYNAYNEHRKTKDIVEEDIYPLIDKKVLLVKGYTKSHLYNDVPNMFLGINPNIVDVDKEKVKHLKLDRFIK